MGKVGEKVQDFEEDEKPQTFAINTDPNITNSYFQTRISSGKTHNPGENRTLAIPSNFSGDLFELEERVKSMMEKSQNRVANGSKFADRCKVCGKEGMGHHIKDHIEANHLEGIAIPCNLCDKTFRSRHTHTHYTV